MAFLSWGPKEGSQLLWRLTSMGIPYYSLTISISTRTALSSSRTPARDIIERERKYNPFIFLVPGKKKIAIFFLSFIISLIFFFRDHFLILLEAESTGRLLRYDPPTKTTNVVLEGLAFPNGVQLSSDQTFLLFTETTNCR